MGYAFQLWAGNRVVALRLVRVQVERAGTLIWRGFVEVMVRCNKINDLRHFLKVLL